MDKRERNPDTLTFNKLFSFNVYNIKSNLFIWDIIAIKMALWIKVWSWLIRLSNCLAPVICVFTGDGAWRMWSIASQQHLRRIISLTDDGFKSESRNTMFHKRAPSKDQRGVCSFRFTFNSPFQCRFLLCSLAVFVSLSQWRSLPFSSGRVLQ